MRIRIRLMDDRRSPAVPAKVLFREEDRFVQPWVWVLLMLALVVVIGLYGWGLVQQLVLGKPWGTRPMGDGELVASAVIVTAVMVAVVWLIASMRLIVEVRSDALIINFRPLTRRVLAYGDIVNCEPRRYRPILHYGGWGLRWGWKSNAYTVRGNEGVWLELAQGRPVLIGSQRPRKLAEAIDRARRGLADTDAAGR
jgi:hypothetical protein